MFKNYLKIAFRNLLKHKTYSSINILGLAIGLACFFLIMFWVRDELSFDRFHQHSDDIYRVAMTINDGSSQSFELALTPPPLATQLKKEFPEVLKSTRYETDTQVVFKYDDKLFFEKNGALVDPEFFEIFSFELIRGNPETALSDPNNLVLTNQLAQKYFGSKNPMGEVLLINEHPFHVTGVIADVPDNSHIQFDFLRSVQFLETTGNDLDGWGNININTYVLLAGNADAQSFNDKLANWETPRINDRFWMQPLTDIHFTGGIAADDSVISDIKYIYIFSFVALCILFIGCMNFINLFTAQSIYRTKEVGIRKVLGSGSVQLRGQFFMETLLLTFIAFVIAVVLLELFIPQFEQLIGRGIQFEILEPVTFVSMTVVFLLTLLLAGLYPALHFSRLNPVHLFGKGGGSGQMKSKLRTSLVVLQFSISIILISSAVIVSQQLNFMTTQSKSFGDESVIYLPFKGELGQHYEQFKERLLSESSIRQVTAKNSLPTQTADMTDNLFWPGKDASKIHLFEGTGVDFDYFKTMGIDVIEGRSFDKALSSDEKLNLVVNKAAVQQMELEDPIGRQITLWGYEGTIIGIAEDVQLQSYESKINPQIFYMIPDYSMEDMQNDGVVLMRVATGNLASTMTRIEDIWQQVNPNVPFEFHFLDEAIDRLYWNEYRLNSIITYATWLAILISCLGLYGLALLGSRLRIKEIGIRKALGASMGSIVALLSKDFTKWVLLANVIAWPVAWYVMNQWLQNFAYRVDLSIVPFLMAGVAALVIAILTISWQAIRAANVNPVESLRSE